MAIIVKNSIEYSRQLHKLFTYDEFNLEEKKHSWDNHEGLV